MTHPSVRIRAALLALAVSAAGLIGGTVATTESDAAFDYNGYIAKAAEAAKASKKLYGVPRAVTIAQSILESGWGNSGLSTKYRNYFGIKCSAVISPHQNGCVALSSYEYVKGKKKKYVSRFRTYRSMEKSFLDHGRMLNYLDRYNAAFRHSNDPDKFIRAVHKAGYATDPNYAALVIKLMKRWNLYRFDTPTATASTTRTTTSKAFIARIAGLARRSEAVTGVPSSVTIAQAMFHSASGTNKLATKAKNYFGMACGKVKSTVTSSCTTISGTKYRSYKSLAASVKDQATVLSTRPRYAKAMKLTAHPKAFLKAVQKAGWSSSKTYATKVYALISTYKLTTYDLLITTTLKKGTTSAKVTALQSLLGRAGVAVKTTGYFGTDTVAAVKKYQKKAKLTVTGKADPLTLTKLTPDVTKGAKGAQVKALQALLKSRKYAVDASGTFGSKTLKSVKALQKKYGLPTTGIVSVRTWGVLFG
ncbi:glucosaminidase domain-containing protein [Micropruina sp.]|uniref:glucosaminidase domain-containing protein n=1 Tax=Micropruina sp. TaxID=2737536 RepID=UPI0039E541B0